MITAKWTVANGEGHWNIYRNNTLICTCDPGEIKNELAQLQKTAFR